MERKCQNALSFLLENAGASIRYRVKKEILGEITGEEENYLQREIMSEPISVLVSGCQKENGWLGNGFRRTVRLQAFSILIHSTKLPRSTRI